MTQSQPAGPLLDRIEAMQDDLLVRLDELNNQLERVLSDVSPGAPLTEPGGD